MFLQQTTKVVFGSSFQTLTALRQSQSPVADLPQMDEVFWLLHTVTNRQLLDQSASDKRAAITLST